METPKFILVACCGSRMFWFDRKNPNVLYIDNREADYQGVWKSTKKDSTRNCSIHPDMTADFRHLPFADNVFYHIIFDPPHLRHIGENAWLAKKYGKLPAEWEKYLKDGFTECWRVLRPGGTLIFKWNEYHIPVKKVIAAIGKDPLYGHKSGKKSLTHWMAFVKIPDMETNEEKSC